MQSKQMKREKAERLTAFRAQRTDQQQLFLLYTRPGQSRKEVARLHQRIANTKGNNHGSV